MEGSDFEKSDPKGDLGSVGIFTCGEQPTEEEVTDYIDDLRKLTDWCGRSRLRAIV